MLFSDFTRARVLYVYVYVCVCVCVCDKEREKLSVVQHTLHWANARVKVKIRAGPVAVDAASKSSKIGLFVLISSCCFDVILRQWKGIFARRRVWRCIPEERSRCGMTRSFHVWKKLENYITFN